METTYSYFITHLTALECLLVEQNNLVSFICITISPSVYKSILLLLCYSLGCPSTHCYFLNRTIYWLLHMYEWNFLSAPVSIQSFFGVSYVFYLFHPSKYYPEIHSLNDLPSSKNLFTVGAGICLFSVTNYWIYKFIRIWESLYLKMLQYFPF